MGNFRKYQHLERFGTQSTDGIEFGKCFVFYKLDGTNSSLWMEENELKAGSRNRELAVGNDNAGFYCEMLKNEKIKAYFTKYPNHRLYGEWLVPHSLKTYRSDAWRRFYVFDVTVDKGSDDVEYIPYDIYKEFLDEFELDYIPPIATVNNPTYETLVRLLDKTGQFLVEDGKGNGEGLVIKNYDFYNKYHKQIWAKIISNEFKEQHHKVMGAPDLNVGKMVEELIVDEFVTEAFIEKEYSKIVVEKDGWDSKMIPMLLNKIFYELINEEMWNIIKKHKNPKIDFKTLNSLTTQKIKSVKRDIFK